jgi:hypothetical protein
MGSTVSSSQFSRRWSEIKQVWHSPFLLWGVTIAIIGFATYLFGILFSIVRLCLFLGRQRISGTSSSSGTAEFQQLSAFCFVQSIFLYSCSPEAAEPRWVEGNESGEFQRSRVTVALTAVQ